MYATITNPDDLWQPKPYIRGVYEASLTVSSLLNSGIVRAPEASAWKGAIQGGGQTLTVEVLPSDLPGESSPHVANRTSTPESLSSGSQQAAVFDREKIWSIHDLSKRKTGMDILMNDIGTKFGRWLAADFEKEISAVLRGAFGPLRWAEGKTEDDFALGMHAIDSVSTATPKILSPTSVRTVKDKFGQFSNRFTTIVVHSHVNHWLEQTYANLYNGDHRRSPNPISSDPIISGPSQFLGTWMGMRLVVSDAVGTVVEGGKTIYATYLTGPGTVLTSEQAMMDYDISRPPHSWSNSVGFSWSDIVHIDGLTWKGGDNIVNGLPRSQLANATNWSLVYDHRNVPLARIATALS